jgi:ATP-binding protein involved in chromosome partitioning
LGVVENMAYFTPLELPDNKYFIFGENGGREFAESNNVPLLGQIPLVQGIRECGDNGKPAAMQNDVIADAFRELAETLAQQVAIRNAESEATKRVEIKV